MTNTETIVRQIIFEGKTSSLKGVVDSVLIAHVEQESAKGNEQTKTY